MLLGGPKRPTISLPDESFNRSPQVNRPTSSVAGSVVQADKNVGFRTEGSHALLPDRAVNRSAVFTAFDASRPINGRSQLFGREKEIKGLLRSVFDFNQHAVIYGARGSGKTSVARVFGDFADQCGSVVLYFPCEPDANFSQLMGALLDGLPKGAVDPLRRAEFARRVEEMPAHFGPLAFVELVADFVVRPVVLILDEFDRITLDQTRTEIAVSMKLLSDNHARIRFVIVGIASSVAQILTGHPSLRRHMSVTRIGRIEPGSVNALMDHGSAAVGLPFSSDARDIVERVSVGSPYHVRLLCRHAALHAISRRSTEVTAADVRSGIVEVLEQWAETNQLDASRFSSIASNIAIRSLAEEVAREAAKFDIFKPTPETLDAVARLGDSIELAEGEQGSYAFVDSLAPQFLIASIASTEEQEDHIKRQRRALEN
ncbi:ATP-binding protein [Sphingobium sp. BS19]|uniref:ATP-binding protein n=1 Tax=Sphingobium sp. BS19 TaxID=3018973 RepID=UPI002490BB86|nr:ATP-binding protein [Sphingobium sp. BS19]|tara:strand:- start:5420 stop:6709 length:1290 start_codon:yes stop_codon:yes gene_type:complete